MADPCLRFLGVPSKADPATLLALPLGNDSRREIEEAMRRQLERTYRHPAGSTAEAEFVRQRLRAAAQELVDASSGAGRVADPLEPLEPPASKSVEENRADDVLREQLQRRARQLAVNARAARQRDVGQRDRGATRQVARTGARRAVVVHLLATN